MRSRRRSSGEVAERVIAAVEKALAGADALCLEDYNKGLLPPEVCRGR